MDPLSIGFLILLVVMCGGIAYLADQVGKKLGKKRLSIGKLRPRHTAAIGTVLLGVIISTFTIAIVLATSSDLRQAIFEGSKAISEKNKAVKDLSDVRNDLIATQAEQAKEKDLSKSLSDQNRQQSDQLKTQTQKLNDLKSAQDTLNNRISSLQKDAVTARQKADAAKLRTDELNSHLNTSKRQLTTAQAQLNDIKENVKASQRILKDESKQNLDLVDANDKLEKQTGQLKANISALSNQITDLAAARSQAEKELSESQARLGDLQKQLANTRNELANTVQALADTEVQTSFYKNSFQITRVLPMIYRIGEEVVRMPIGGGLSVKASQETLTSFLRQARIAALTRGAKGNEQFAEATIVGHTDKRTGLSVSPEIIERDIVTKIAGAPGEVVIVATSSLNAFRGEPVSLEISVLSNPKVYVAGQVISEAVIDGNKGDTVIWEELSEFLEKKVKDRARQDGMIPIANSDVSFGQVTQSEVLQIIERLRASDRPVRLQVIAAADTRAADTLRLEFRIR